MTEIVEDGRVARGARTREAVIDAMLALHAEGDLTPTIEAIARPPTGTRAERIAGIATHRSELFEAVAPARRSALVRMHKSPELQKQQAMLAAHLRKHLARTFEPELSALSAAAADETLELLDLHTSWETWDRLRTRQSLSVERSRRLMTGLITQALSH